MKDFFINLIHALLSLIVVIAILYYLAPQTTEKILHSGSSIIMGLNGKGDQILNQ